MKLPYSIVSSSKVSPWTTIRLPSQLFAHEPRVRIYLLCLCYDELQVISCLPIYCSPCRCVRWLPFRIVQVVLVKKDVNQFVFQDCDRRYSTHGLVPLRSMLLPDGMARLLNWIIVALMSLSRHLRGNARVIFVFPLHVCPSINRSSVPYGTGRFLENCVRVMQSFNTVKGQFWKRIFARVKKRKDCKIISLQNNRGVRGIALIWVEVRSCVQHCTSEWYYTQDCV
jgi:hypothetical protein